MKLLKRASLALIIASGPAHAGVIDPAGFGGLAHTQTFDSQAVGSAAGSLVLDGVTYSFLPGGYQIVAADAPNYMCIAGNCLGNLASGAFWTITLSVAVDRVGGYLSGAGDNLIPAQTDITYYDVNNVQIGDTFHPITQSNKASSPAFFGFESDASPIMFVRIRPNSGPFITTLDNFTTEILAPVPEPSTWAMMILGFAGVGFMTYRRRKGAGRAVAC